jgi:hypothetical protein
MPAGPGVYLADGDDALFPAWYERLVAEARPDIAVAEPELCRDSWFMVQLDRMLPELYVPYADDGVGGRELAMKMARVNAEQGRAVGADDWRRVALRMRPMGWGYRVGAGNGDRLDRPEFGGGTGRRVAGRVALTRALYEAAHGRLADAARAAGIAARFDAAALQQLERAAIDPARPPLWGFVPRSTPYHVHASWLMDLLADDLAWVAGLPDAALPPGAPRERRIHALWRRLLRGERVDAELAALGSDVAEATAALIARTRPDLRLP